MDSSPNVKTIVLEHLPSLRRYARALVGSKQGADELVQECIVRILARRRCLDDVRNHRAYLFSILHNVYVDATKQAKAMNGKGYDDHHLLATSCAPPQPSRLELQDLERALRRLPDEQRQVILLVGLEGMPYREVAEVLDIPIGTVMSRLSRGREALRQMMDGRLPRIADDAAKETRAKARRPLSAGWRDPPRSPRRSACRG
ncbi:MAG: sigma-70 family RNA polymerase sigma factor [Alphaproteobacteria bacterium]